MANVRESSYVQMIADLHQFASSLYTIASNMGSLATVCSTAMNGDIIAEKHRKALLACTVKYADVSNQARSLASAMEEKLQQIRDANRRASEE